MGGWGRVNPNFYKSSRTYFIFKRHQKVVSVYCKYSKPYSDDFPSWCDPMNRTDFIDFGLYFDNKVVVGTLCERYTRLNDDSVSESKFECVLYEYSPKKNIWQELPEKTRYKYDVIGYRKKYVTISSCLIGNSKILSFVRERNYMRSEGLHNTNVLLMLDPNMKMLNMRKAPKNCSVLEVQLPDSLKSLLDFSMVNINQTQVLVIGGIYDHGRDRTKFNHLIWKGTMNDEENDIHWVSLDCKMSKALTQPNCFKLKDSIYIVSRNAAIMEYTPCSSKLRNSFRCFISSSHRDDTCDRYNIGTSKYDENVWQLHNHYSLSGVMTDANETFAIMMNETYQDTSILSFTEHRGFEYVKDKLVIPSFMEDQCYEDSRAGHVIIRIK